MTLLLTDADVREVVDMAAIVEAVDDALAVEARGGVQIVPRINFGLRQGFLRFMPAVIEELDVMGFKAFDAKFPTARYLIAVFRPSTGELDCLVDAAYLTAVRTGATTGVATRLMTATDGCREVGVIGSGLEARTNLEAILAVREVRRVLVYSRTPERREALAAEVRERHGIEAVAVGTPQEAAGAPCVLAATNTGFGGPVALEGAWLAPDAHLNTIGATALDLREADPETFARASAIVVDTEHAGAECGDIVAAQRAGAWPAGRVTTLAELVGAEGGWRRPEGLSVFKSVGTAVQDLAAAHAVATAARERGVGREVELLSAKTF
ncbi:MAG TPA: ornithine cyclodeaminase family protein [Solirubrobacteraceae bacterium]|nr:ornithine cyclodeaminase family protein [Solirubrobacteraceae bacterium]